MLLTSAMIKSTCGVLTERKVKAVDTDCKLMKGIEYTISDILQDSYIDTILAKYNNVLIYKRDLVQCIAVFPHAANAVYTLL